MRLAHKKYCASHEAWLPESEFEGSSDSDQCRKCWEAAPVERTPPKYSTNKRRPRQTLRHKAITKLGGKCSNQECRWLADDWSFGCQDWNMLDIDHIWGNGKEERNILNPNDICRKILQDPSGYQLLCANCHRIKTLAALKRKKP